MGQDIAQATLAELSQGIGTGAFRATDVAACFLARIRHFDGRLRAFVRVVEDEVMAQAEASERRRAAGYSLGPLDGVPVAVKDLFDIEGQITGVGSAAFARRRSTATAVAVRRLMRAGVVILGKTQMVEFAFGGWGTNPLLGTPVNPWDSATERIPGGSSSGSGVAVAARLAPAALGSDTGGSVRIPAALNGITGLKTTYGVISLEGAFPLSPTLDSVGPMTRDAVDAALLMNVLAGPDGDEGRERRAPFPAPPRSGADLRGMRIAMLAPEQFPIEVSPGVASCHRDFGGLLSSLGAVVEEVRFPFDFHAMMLRNGALIAAEAFAIHRARIDDDSEPIGPWVRRRVQGGRTVSAADYIDALAAHRAQCRAWIDWMQNHEVLLTPTLPMAACPIDAVDESATPLAAFTRAGNYLGACGISLPAGFEHGLPIAMQLLGKPLDDALLLRIGAVVQSATDWHLRMPPGLDRSS